MTWEADDEILAGEENVGERLDIFLAASYTELSRGLIQELIKSGQVFVNGQKTKSSYRLKAEDTVSIQIPAAIPLELKAENIALNIIYQDEDIAVIDKPKGMVVHPAHGNWEHTLVNALLFHIKDLSGINGKLRPGIVHRLDKDTSGLLVIAKNDRAHRQLTEQIKNHSMRREYMALVHGVIQENLGTIDAPIGRSKIDRKKMAVLADGKPSISHYTVLERFLQYTLVRVQLMTGRTHQIRVHFAYIQHSVVNDPLYGSGRKHFGQDSQMLHAGFLSLVHPVSGEEMHFTSPLAEYFQVALQELGKNNQASK